MSIDAFEDSISLQVRILEAVEPTRSSYPFPALVPTARFETREFRTIVLEHEYLRLTFLPDLGGRIFAIFDKRNGAEVFADDGVIDIAESGPRGAEWRHGISFHYGAESRLNDLGTVRTAVQPDEHGDPHLWVCDHVGGRGLAYRMQVCLLEAQAAFRVRVSTQNRTDSALAFCGRLEFAGMIFGEDQVARATSRALFVDAPNGTFARLQDDSAWIALPGGALGPRQTHSVDVVIHVSTGISAAAVGRHFAIGQTQDTLRLQAQSPRMAQRVAIQTSSGQTLEAVSDLFPERIWEIPLAEIGGSISRIAFLDTRDSITESLPLTFESVLATPAAAILKRKLDSPNAARAALIDPAWRPYACLVLARSALREESRDAAQTFYEQSLLYNGDDAVAWCEKAVAAGVSPEAESDDLLNAHYIAPLEPALRAAQFLAQGHQVEASPLVAPLAEVPEELIEVACLLLEAGLHEEAGRWIDEALRHADLAMLRYFRAFLLCTVTRLDIEAAAEMRRAATLSGRPPLPWRGMEETVLKTLVERFGEDQALRELWGMVQKFVLSEGSEFESQ